MIGKGSIPWPGVVLATTAATAMLIAGVGFWLVLAVTVVWLGSLWLVTPLPDVSEASGAQAASPRRDLSDPIEPLGFPILLLDERRILAANAAARATLGAHVIGQDARIALRHPEAVRLLDLPDDESVTIAGLTGTRSLWQLTRRRIDDRHWLIELHDRTAAADMSRAHTDFVANASHELRTPLSAIIGYVETLSDAGTTLEPAMQERFYDTVLREARRMQSLVSDLMSLSQLEAEKHDLPTDPLDLGQIAAQVVGEFSARPDAARVLLSRPDVQLPVTGDASQLSQLVRNLIDNALKYGEAGTPVDVMIEQCGNATAVLTVRDRGPGIAARHLPHLTRRFYRTDPGRSRAAGGTGLGLAIVKHIVERHRGKLDISSTPGVGTTVRIDLPTRGEALE